MNVCFTPIILLCACHYTFFPLQTNTFQCVLFTNGAQSHVLFLYADGLIQWTAARSTDLNALAGVNAGDGVNYAIVPESLNISIINVSSTTNVGVGGMWLFRIDTGTFGAEEERGSLGGNHTCIGIIREMRNGLGR